MSESIDRLLDLAVRIQQIPAPTSHEGKRAEFVCRLFEGEGLHDVSRDALDNVYARLEGRGAGKPLIVSAHLDTVFPENTDLKLTREEGRIYGPGLGDNSLGVAALFGLLWRLRQDGREPAGDIWLVADAGEEGLGDLRGMKAVVDRFGAEVQAYLVLEGAALGHVYHRAVGVRRSRITVRTPGGHSWSDYGQPSAVHELAQLVTRLTSLALPLAPRTTLNVGLISGGTGVNVLASEASCQLDLRSEGSQTLADVASNVDALIQAAGREGVHVETETIGRRPAGEIPAAHPLVRLAVDCLLEQGLTPALTGGSTDANVPLSLGHPALVLGITSGGGAHTVHEYIETAPVEQGMGQLARFVESVWEAGGA